MMGGIGGSSKWMTGNWITVEVTCIVLHFKGIQMGTARKALFICMWNKSNLHS